MVHIILLKYLSYIYFREKLRPAKRIRKFKKRLIVRRIRSLKNVQEITVLVIAFNIKEILPDSFVGLVIFFYKDRNVSYLIVLRSHQPSINSKEPSIRIKVLFKIRNKK